jgi:hypothetical protein
MLAIFKSDDLTYVDKTRVAAALKAEYEERLSLQDKPKGPGSEDGEWLNARALAIDPEATFARISPLLDTKPLNDAAIADSILTMIVNGEIS